ncbi:SDR family oxidoreductase [Halopiger goleimassiliensis]|uniref:SDR family oxidoreductase n=1 Tax=Halopiger goleimassiliensis TaxID=1293048 RepID=UPI000677A487|nr:SDR family oxidoreductase [Halopiger goleimassiliensis]
MTASAVEVDFSGTVAVVTGASGALGSAVVDHFHDSRATVCAVDVRAPADEESHLTVSDRDRVAFYEADLTDEDAVTSLVGHVVDDHGRIDHLLNVAGTWRGGQSIEETPLSEFDFLVDVNLKTAFLASKHALPHLQETNGSIVSVSARSSLEGGEGDGPYRITKAGIRLLTETLAAENLGTVRANCVMPSVIDTPANRELMPDADHESWVDPVDIADVMAVLCSDATAVTSGAAVPVYGEA